MVLYNVRKGPSEQLMYYIHSIPEGKKNGGGGSSVNWSVENGGGGPVAPPAMAPSSSNITA